MTMSTDATSDDNGKSTALAPIPDAPGVDPFVAPAIENPATPRGARARLLDYSAHAAMIVGLLGFAWTVGDHVVHRPSAAPAATAKALAAAPATDPIGELRSRNLELAETVHALQARLDTLQTNLGDQGKVAAQVRVLQAGLDSVKANLGTSRSEQSAAIVRLDGKIDKLAHEPGSKMQQLVDRLGKLERSTIDVAPTASLPHADSKAAGTKPLDVAKLAETKRADDDSMAVRPVPRPVDLKTTDRTIEAKSPPVDDPAKPQVIANWVVRDVYQGVALIEGRRGTLEVVPGVSIPGAGVVKSIDRHGNGWTVTTTKGVVAYAAPARDYRRADRSYYPGSAYRYDF